jgi:ubiquinone/menaquinone biosynthesis C-methylase UbiE
MCYWDTAYYSGDYLRHWDYKYPSQELIAALATLGSPAKNSVALDVGCGAGREAVFLAQCGFRVFGIDFSRQALKIAKSRAKEAGVSVHWRCSTVLKLPLVAASVDFVNDRGCFHVIAENDQPKFVRELARVMKSGACMLLRGSCQAGKEGFTPLDKKTLKRFFPQSLFDRGPLLPIRLMSDSGTLNANLILLTRK